MGAKVGQQTGWIHLGDLTIAFVFPVPLVQNESESEQVPGLEAID
jgi:hypothetical protein